MDGVDKIIEKAFKDNPKSDVLIFKLNNWETKCPSHTKNVGYIQAMRTASYQIAFRRTKIKEKNISFDEEMGSGTGNVNSCSLVYAKGCDLLLYQRR